MPRGAGAPVSATDHVAWRFEVTALADQTLSIEGDFRGPVSALAIEPGVERFVEGLAVRQGSGLVSVAPRDARLASLCARACRVQYRFRLQDAARELADVDLALAAGGASFAPPSTWLVHPETSAPGSRYRFHVTLPEGIRFATGIRRAPPEADDTFEADTESFEESSFAAFGPVAVRAVGPPGTSVVIASGLRVSEASVLAWAALELGIVTDFFGRLPSDAVTLFVVPGTSEVMRGKTLGGGGVSVFIRVGTGVTEASLKDDWVLCHELIHVGFPSTERGQAWFSEGLASYVEPVIRARAGLISKEKFWADLVDGLPQGLPGPGDRGLENNGAWGRIYWGGSLYFLLADLAIREGTSGARSLEDAVRSAAGKGVDVETFEPLSQVIDASDRGTGTHVLRDLYERLARAPGTEDLDALWRRLGVIRNGKTVTFDDGAPGAALTAAVPAPRSRR